MGRGTKTRIRKTTRIGVATVFLLLAGCGSSASSSKPGAAPASRPRTIAVVISGYAFHPADIVVATASKIRVSNHDHTAHTATAIGQVPAFDTGTLKDGESKTITLTRAGRYVYYCQFHAFMRGTITVRSRE